MKEINLAGGEGKRMWPITQEKYLLPFLGKPLIHYRISGYLETELDKLSKENKK